MKNYIDILEVSPLGDGKNWILRDGFYYVYRDTNKGRDYHIEVPPKFMTDYASIPGVLWWFGKPWGKHGMAAVIHDWLYWEQKLCGENLSRKYADEIFHRCMVDSQVSKSKARLMYWAVKWFAKGAWDGNKKRKDEGWHRVAAKWPEKVFDTPEDLQASEEEIKH